MSLLRRTLFVMPLFVAITIMVGVMITVFDPAYTQMITVDGTDALGLDSAIETVYQSAAVGMVGLLLVLSAWWITGDLRNDLFQGRR